MVEPLSLSPLTAISAVDGRYAKQTAALSPFLSEFGLFKYRVFVEVEWLLALSESSEISEVRPFTDDEKTTLKAISSTFGVCEAERVKQIEATTNHDVKAVEYFVKERLAQTSLSDVREWVHFACTSEDINNLAYALMLKGAMEQVILPTLTQLIETVYALAQATASDAMLSHTHGQPASPTTLGKELAVFVRRWNRTVAQLKNQEYLGKVNGAVGNFNAHQIAYPHVRWEQIAERFVSGLGLDYNPLTTQIEPHDYVAELFHSLVRFNTVLLDFDRDIWSYVSLGYFKQKLVAGEVGSSTMPHKVNPIDFETSEANAQIANALLEHLAVKLPVSRLQRDLSDSSALRSAGIVFAHTLVAVRSALRGIGKLQVNKAALQNDLAQTWEVLGEAVQTVMRKHGHENPYEKLKELTRGAQITPESLRAFIKDLELPGEDKARLLALTPDTYIGIAPDLVRHGKTDE